MLWILQTLGLPFNWRFFLLTRVEPSVLVALTLGMKTSDSRQKKLEAKETRGNIMADSRLCIIQISLIIGKCYLTRGISFIDSS